jgi:hypothetical protein
MLSSTFDDKNFVSNIQMHFSLNWWRDDNRRVFLYFVFISIPC